MLPRPSRCISSCVRANSICLPSRLAYAPFSSSSRRNGYDDTIPNLKIGAHTRVIFQGFTGKQATANARESLEWGTQIVGGVKPGGSGEHLGLPVLPSVRAAMEQLKPDATGIYVAAHQAPAAIEEAIEAEVPLIVAVAEHIPLHDIMRASIARQKLRFLGLTKNRYTLCCKRSQSQGLWAQTPLALYQRLGDVESASNRSRPSPQDTSEL